MKKMNVFKTKAMMFCLVGFLMCVSIVSFNGCKNKDEPTTQLVVSPTSVSVKVGDTQSVTIKDGNGDYKVAVGDATIASATIDGSTIAIKGLKNGTTAVTVTDKGNQSTQIQVTVSDTAPAALAVDASTVSVNIDATKTVTISGGTPAYTATSKDVAIATATLSGTSVTVKGIAEGSTTVTVKDAGNQTKDIAVTVTKVPTETSAGVPMNTVKKYNLTVLTGEKGMGSTGWSNPGVSQTGTILISRTDFMNNINTSSLIADDFTTLTDWFGNYCKDPNAFMCAGYYDAPNYTYGYAAPCLLLTNTDDPNHAGMKKMTVLSCDLAAPMGWPGYSEKKSAATAYYNPSDGSFTINVAGYLGWGFDFAYVRKYTPAN